MTLVEEAHNPPVRGALRVLNVSSRDVIDSTQYLSGDTSIKWKQQFILPIVLLMIQ